MDKINNVMFMYMQLLLSSSMDKTVRLWDMETQNCLKMFAHNDYGEMAYSYTSKHHGIDPAVLVC